MLHTTKLVIGKACVSERFRKALFQAASAPDAPGLAALQGVLEANEIYASYDELLEVLAVAGPLKIDDEGVKRIVDCLQNDPLGADLSRVLHGRGPEKAKRTDESDESDDLAALINAILGTPPSLAGVIKLTRCLICKGLEGEQMERFSPPKQLRCPRWPCPEP